MSRRVMLLTIVLLGLASQVAAAKPYAPAKVACHNSKWTWQTVSDNVFHDVVSATAAACSSSKVAVCQKVGEAAAEGWYVYDKTKVAATGGALLVLDSVCGNLHYPVCLYTGTSAKNGWYWADTKTLIKLQACVALDETTLNCRMVGTSAESFVTADGNTLAYWPACHRVETTELPFDYCGDYAGHIDRCDYEHDCTELRTLGLDANGEFVKRCLPTGRTAHFPVCWFDQAAYEGWYWYDTLEQIALTNACPPLNSYDLTCANSTTADEAFVAVLANGAVTTIVKSSECHTTMAVEVGGDFCGDYNGHIDRCEYGYDCKVLGFDEEVGEDKKVCKPYGWCGAFDTACPAGKSCNVALNACQ